MAEKRIADVRRKVSKFLDTEVPVQTGNIVETQDLTKVYRMGKIDICMKITSNPFMIRELFAIIRGDCMGSDR